MTDNTLTAREGTAKLVKFFGKRPGQTLAEIAAEIRELSDTDHAQLVGGITDGTLDY